MKKRMKKAAVIAAFGYCSVTAFCCGMLKAAQKTRQTLYGGQPVMAQVVRQTLPESRTAYTVSLGGGEWGFRFSLPSYAETEQAAEQLPPCMGKLLLEIFLFTERAADQTAEWISGI